MVNENFQNNYLENLLAERGVVDLQNYLNPPEDFLNEPEKLDNMAAGWELLKKKIEKNEKLLLIVDCDVDGFTSSAVMYNYIKHNWPEIEIDYLLHEGKQHGLEDHCEHLIDIGPVYGLVICPDSSSNDAKYHDELGSMGVPVLVLDHHDVDEPHIYSNNAIIINNQLSKGYENKELTGAGVAW